MSISRGVVAHFLSKLNSELALSAGCQIARVVWRWKDIQRNGVYSWSSTDNQVDIAAKAKLCLYASLGHPPAEKAIGGERGHGAVPKSMAEWGEHVRAVVSRYKNRGIIWGIHNEPNLSDHWKGSEAQYVELLKTASVVIREVDPEARIAAPDLATISSGDWPAWLDLMAANRDLYDILSIHAYSDTASKLKTKWLDGEWGFLQVWFPKFRPIKPYLDRIGKPVWLTETGFRTNKMSESRQAEEIKALGTILPDLGVEACLVYELRDDKAIADKWGLYRFDGAAKPAVKAWRDALPAPPPTPEPEPPPADPITPVKYEAIRRSNAVMGKEHKGSGLYLNAKGDVYEAIYKNTNPRNETYIWCNGKRVAKIGGETANFFPGRDGRLWLSVEMGTTGEPCEIIGTRLRGLGWKGHYMGCGADIGGSPFFFDLAKAKDARPTCRDEKGKIIHTFQTGHGIPYDVAVFASGDYAISLCDGKNNGISWSTGQHIKCDARGLVNRNGILLAGVGGRLMEVTKADLGAALTDKLGDSIDSLALDPDGNLWISVSNPDSLYYLSPDDRLVQVASFKDASDGGALFRSRVTCGGGRIIWGINRRSDNHWETFNILRKL